MMIFGKVSGEVQAMVAGLQVRAKGYILEGEDDFHSLRAFHR